jgi:hypothetical protein
MMIDDGYQKQRPPYAPAPSTKKNALFPTIFLALRLLACASIEAHHHAEDLHRS